MGDIIEVMVDIETLATVPNAHILSIGACIMGDPSLTYYMVPGIDDQDRIVNDDTIDWWAKQSEAAREESFRSTHVTLKRALNEFSTWWNNAGATRIWANSPSFDCVILEDAFRQHGIKCPWQFWLTQDQRTMIKLSEKLFNGKTFEPNRTGTHHNALDDAIFQAQWMGNIEREIKSAIAGSGTGEEHF